MKVLVVLALAHIGTKVSTAAGLVCTTDKADIIFALDGSSSFTANDFALQQEFAANVSAAFKVGLADTRFGAVLFSFQRAPIVFDLDTYDNNQDIFQTLLTAPLMYSFDGAPWTEMGMLRANIMMTTKARPTADRVVIIITGNEPDRPNDPKVWALQLRRINVTILGVGVGDAVQSDLLNYSNQPDYVFIVDSYKDIWTLEDAVIGKICQVQPQCPNGQVVGSQCLTLSSQKMTKADATQSCAANNGGKIFEIRSEELYIQLGGIAKEYGLKLWAGAEEAAEGEWKWISDNSSATLSKNWFKWGEPNNWRGNEECLQMRPNGKLNDAHCDKRFHFVCVN